MSVEHDVTRFLRGRDADLREVIQSNAGTMFMRMAEENVCSHAEIRRIAKHCIDAACIFSEEFSVAALNMEDDTPGEEIDYCNWGWP